jgi:hypothetical protein
MMAGEGEQYQYCFTFSIISSTRGRLLIGLVPEAEAITLTAMPNTGALHGQSTWISLGDCSVGGVSLHERLRWPQLGAGSDIGVMVDRNQLSPTFNSVWIAAKSAGNPTSLWHDLIGPIFDGAQWMRTPYTMRLALTDTDDTLRSLPAPSSPTCEQKMLAMLRTYTYMQNELSRVNDVVRTDRVEKALAALATNTDGSDSGTAVRRTFAELTTELRVHRPDGAPANWQPSARYWLDASAATLAQQAADNEEQRRRAEAAAQAARDAELAAEARREAADPAYALQKGRYTPAHFRSQHPAFANLVDDYFQKTPFKGTDEHTYFSRIHHYLVTYPTVTIAFLEVKILGRGRLP